MKFFTIMYNDGFNTAACAARLGMKLRRSGHFGGWLSQEQLDELEKGGFLYKVVY